MGKCTDLGTSKTSCQEQCDPDADECWQKTTIEKCSCHGYVSHLAEMAVYGYNGTNALKKNDGAEIRRKKDTTQYFT